MSSKHMTISRQQFFTAAEAARLLKTNRNYITILCRENRLVGVKIANRWFVGAKSISNFKFKK